MYNFDKIIIRYIRDAQISFETLKKGDLDYMPIRIGNSELWRQTKTDKAFTKGKIRALAVSSRLQQAPIGGTVIQGDGSQSVFAPSNVPERAVMRVQLHICHRLHRGHKGCRFQPMA